MIRTINKFLLSLKAPKNGDVFYGDSMDLMPDRPSERIFFPLHDRYGVTKHNVRNGKNTYRFTIQSTAMPYYILLVEVFVEDSKNRLRTQWLPRSMVRRMWKKDFHDLILDKRLVKAEKLLFHEALHSKDENLEGRSA